MEENKELFKKLQNFSNDNEQLRIAFKILDERKNLKDSEKADLLLDYLAKEIFIVSQYFEIVLENFPKEVPTLLAHAIRFTDEFPFNHQRHVINCILLSKIVKTRSDLKSFVLQYFKKYPSPFDEFESHSKPKKIKTVLPYTVTDLDIVECCYFLLQSDAKYFRNKWKWSNFIKKYVSSEDCKITWIYCQIVAIVLGLNESNLQILLNQKLSSDTIIQLIIDWNKIGGFSKISYETHTIDQHPIKSLKYSPITDVTNISGVYVPVLKATKDKNLIQVPSTWNNLKKIAIGLSSGQAICLQGVVGSGKTILVDYIASCAGRILGQTFIKVQMDDQMDSKMLLGTYRSSDIPGEFIWQPGVLTQAVVEGHWLLLEDIDLVNMDIASVICSLLENNSLTVPGYRDSVPITPGFQLFVTQRLITSSTGQQKRYTNSLYLLEKQLFQVTIDPLTSEELKQILNVKYQKFQTVADRLINVFELFTNKVNELPILRKKSTRSLSTRDFFKWCSRSHRDFTVHSQESALKLLQNAIDVFCCSFANQEEALNLAKSICSTLGIVSQKADYFFNNYKPLLKMLPNDFQSGRVTLERKHSMYSKQNQFCFTRPAAVLLERIMCCVKFKEPVLLVGETGTGKTSLVQYLANTLGEKLIVINMNQQSDSADLLGGFKPVDLKTILAPLRNEFESVFRDFFDMGPNQEYLTKVAFAYNKQKYVRLVSLMQLSVTAALKRLTTLVGRTDISQEKQIKDKIFLDRWQSINEKLKKIEIQLRQTNAFYFNFIEGSLTKAVQNGSWVLLDEINLANAETLECLSGKHIFKHFLQVFFVTFICVGLLENTDGSLCLFERGDKKPVQRHPNFTLFACMNPATNIGKKDLPTGLRNRFTEFYVEELSDKTDLCLLINSYLKASNLKGSEISNIADFYLTVRKEMKTTLCDSMGHKPHFSLRSLCRALMISAKNPCGTFNKSLYEAFCLSFLTRLNSDSYKIVQNLIMKFLIGNPNKLKMIQNQPITAPADRGFLEFEGFWIKEGFMSPNTPDNYVLTKSIRKNLKDLARIVSIGKLPVLLQGDTSVGKTSLIMYLAKSSGNKCVRINNHEHTDLQEYIGSYVADPAGKLVFREGVLVEAMRKGHWIILDELNLAPTDVLEALNRVLDDNRELFIPETQETIKAASNFILFATQNPPGVYGGRKMLSEAFRNRFVELHFNEIPPDELEIILQQRCTMPPTYAKKMINVMIDLQMRRRGSAAFAGKHGFITLRDLFRWGDRYRLASCNSGSLYDWDQHLADEGYLVLAGKVRKEEESQEIVTVLEKHWRRKVEERNLFTLHDNSSTVTKHILKTLIEHSQEFPHIVWTFNMRKLATLVAKAIEFKEPLLLVGETGGGKTTVCQLIAKIFDQNLVTVNCHMHTESSDFIGGLRPVRDHSVNSKSLFEWVNGPLLQALMEGSVFLADEISLADDSVLERLNSLLEPERTLLLPEKGIDLNNLNNSETVVAHQSFVFIGTMNPAGDYGKKELSPALRNRFTEIWCDTCTDSNDLVMIVNKNLSFQLEIDLGRKMIEFIQWFRETDIGKRCTISIRDILTWVYFINKCLKKIPLVDCYVQGAHLVFLDSLGSGISSTESTLSIAHFKNRCIEFLYNQFSLQVSPINCGKVIQTDSHFGIEPFFIELGSEPVPFSELFSFHAPTTILNTLNILRGMQLNKAILLEGSPGVGKTSLITALARFSKQKIFRVNLSDQTDISDLFGADLPVEGGKGGEFAWRDGPLLQALKEGSWILLDELNLASQSVLEGLNACFDHRGEIFVPELGKTFHIKIGTRFFACQNPMKQGGSRRGLPKSFLNRFIQVYMSPFTAEDLQIILIDQFPTIPKEIISKMIAFNFKLAGALNGHLFGNKGAPWECNLRDLTRWCQATLYHFNNTLSTNEKKLCPEYTAQLIYVDRMRNFTDKRKVKEIFEEVMHCSIKNSNHLTYIEKNYIHLGDIKLKREQDEINDHVLNQENGQLILRNQLRVLRSLTYCINQHWMAILVGNSGVGKSAVVKTLADLAGKTLKTLPVTSAMDTTDILGGFEQTTYTRHLEEIAKEAEHQTLIVARNLLIEEKVYKAAQILEYWEEYITISDSTTKTMEEEVQLFTRRLSKLETLLKELYLKCSSTNEATVILQLLNRCTELIQSVNDDKSLNAGGCFEWVNSILVKCLQEGHWLLVDNVNLCSAAVLDRLNGLLEPNGVLTISEKGINENGEMFVVKPHKDFRIFLTMDPKHGEISRAMRNRGIEICMLNDSETNDLDIQSLIRSKDLTDPKLINALLNIHGFISNLILSEKPKISDLLQCATLVGQQTLHGIDPNQAVNDTCIEIYFKTRILSEFNCNNVLEVIKDGIQRYLKLDSIQSGVIEKTVTINTKKLNSMSMFEQIKHHCAIFHNILENSIDFSMEKFKEKQSDLQKILFINELFEKMNFYSLTNLLVLNFALSSQNDIELRSNFLHTLVTAQSSSPILQQALKRFTKVVKYFESHNQNLPFDDRWISDTFHKVNQSTNETINYALQLEIHKLRDTLETQQVYCKKSLYTYFLAVKRKEVVDAFNDPLCGNYLKLESEYYIFMRQLCSHFSKIKDDGRTLIKILELYSWRQALHTYLTSVSKPSPKSYEDKLNFAIVYYKWFHKYSVLMVARLLDVKVPQALREILTIINKEIANANEEERLAKSYKLAKNYRKFNHVPQSFTHADELIALKFLENYDLNDTRNDSTTILALFKSVPEYRNLLIQLKQRTLDRSHNNKELSSALQMAKSFNKEQHNNVALKLQEIQVLPLANVLTQKLLLQTWKNVYIGENSNQLWLECLIKNNILVRVNLAGVLLTFNRTRDPKMIHEIKKEFYYSSFTTLPVAYFENNRKNVVSGIEAELFDLITRLLIPDGKYKATLKDFKDVQLQLKFIKACLWSHVQELSEENFDFLSVQRQILHLEYKQFWEKLSEANKNINCSDSEFQSVLEKIRFKYKKLNENCPHDLCLSLIGDVHMNLSFAELYLNSLLPKIDPLAKKTMKKSHVMSVLTMFEQMKCSFELQSQLFINNSTGDYVKDHSHPYIQQINNMIQELKKRLDCFGDDATKLDGNITYSYVVQQIRHAYNNVLKSSILNDVARCDEILDTSKHKEEIRYFIESFESILLSLDRILLNFKQFSSSYPDIMEPLLANIAQFLYGFKIKLFYFKRKLSELKSVRNVEQEILTLLKLPSLNKDISDLDSLANFYGTIMHNSKEDSIRLIKFEIQERFNQCILSARGFQEIDYKSLEEFNKTVRKFIKLYNQQLTEKEELKKTTESLYKVRICCVDKTDEEIEADLINDLFSNHVQFVDFSDMTGKTSLNPLNDSSHQETGTRDDIHQKEVLSEEDLRFVQRLHTSLNKHFIRTEWLSPAEEEIKSIQPDYTSSLMEKYRLVRNLLDKTPHYMPYTVDKELYASLIILLMDKQQYDGYTTSAHITNDFYKDPNIEEVKSCLGILTNIKEKVEKLLLQWPDQPTLNSILVVIERILNFDIQSPIARYLTGLDILLTKCYEWEQVAHSGVSLINETPELLSQIVEWRKMELNRWKDLLNITFSEMSTKQLCKWWLHLYNLIKQYNEDENNEMSEIQLVDVLQKFITASPVAAFQGRLELLLEFHCYVLTLTPQTKKTKALINILWNLYKYYSQFATIVSQKIQDLRAPIEKKLKEYVKIIRWKDVNYWSVKDSVEKAYKTLGKFVKEYKELLSQLVTPFLTNHENLDTLQTGGGIWDRPQRQSVKSYHYSLDANSYIISKSSSGTLRLVPYLKTARKLCKEIIEATNYPDLIKSFDSFICEVIENSDHFRKLEIDRSVSKEKQKSQAKTILNQKRRALANLFQTLSKLGVSYKTGLIDRKLKNAIDDLKLDPVDLSASFSLLRQIFGVNLTKTDEKLLTIWDSSELYYYRCLFRFEVLETASLTKSNKDLGPQNTERCLGYANDLITLCQRQKKTLIKSSRSHYELRKCLKRIHQICENEDPEAYVTLNFIEELKNLVNSSSVIISQLELVVQSNFEESTLDITSNNDFFVQFSLTEDSTWQNWKENAAKKLCTTKKLLKKVQEELAYPIYNDVSQFVLCINKTALLDSLEMFSQDIAELREHFGTMTAVVDSLNWLAVSFKKCLDVERQQEFPTETRTSVYQKTLNVCRKSLLIMIQDIYKKKDKLDTQKEIESLEENHLKQLIVENLSEDLLINLNLRKIVKIGEKLLKCLVVNTPHLKDASTSPSQQIFIQIRTQIAPLFEQCIQLSEYFITQQVAAYRTTCKFTSILLKIFIELVSKGFCIPPDLMSDEEMSTDSKQQPSNGMGFGEDGEGEKDVSNQIESEDQLEGAQSADNKQNEEEKETEPDCKEEDNGIEMREDFDSKLQEKKPRSDDEESDTNSDAEEQMGETEAGAEQLDEEIWGEDQDPDENDEGQDNEDDDGKGGGEKDGEDFLDAKNNEDRKTTKEKDKENTSPNDDEDNEVKEKTEINDMKDQEFDDEQIDPYHGTQSEELPEPEAMDLPDDLQLDEGEAEDNNDDENTNNENPFDIDEMKENVEQKKDDETKESDDDDQERDDEIDFSSDDEDLIRENGQKEKIDEKYENEQNKDDDKGPDIGLDESPSTNEQEQPAEAAPNENQTEVATNIPEPTRTDYVNSTTDPSDTSSQENKKEKENGLGNDAETVETSGQSSLAQNQERTVPSSVENEENKSSNRNPGETDLKRSLGDVDKQIEKKLKTMDTTSSEEKITLENNENNQEADLFQHIDNEKNDIDADMPQILDAATKEQLEEQQNKYEDDLTEKEETTDKNLSSDERKKEKMDMDETPSSNAEQKLKRKRQNKEPGEILNEPMEIDMEHEDENEDLLVKTHTVPRGLESFHGTRLFDEKTSNSQAHILSQQEIVELRSQVEHELSTWKSTGSVSDFHVAEQIWQQISSITLNLAQDLSEQLRLILEPTMASHLKGDFRTGRRINMRKIIPYIASQFRKDKIWLRRTKPSKRNYQIALAIDDSSSMTANHSKELTFESVALISKALSLIESGELAVLSFGEEIEIVHKLTEKFTDKSGANVLQKFKFAQNKTRIGHLLDFVQEMFEQQPNSHIGHDNHHKLLLIVSDGRGIFSEGKAAVNRAVRSAKLSDIFIVFIIIDSPENKHSILDIKSTEFKDGQFVTFQNYMDEFPFSFYLILRDINCLPGVLSDALMQWFEIITSSSS
ncbi:hypothetical protein ABEB36_010268 [Hypothenemus hampei]|uniref:Midasin n=1 Tax=Hypothenemus hampei TaxID=57062 RepID=A0ABD1EJJ6_HYPHA